MRYLAGTAALTMLGVLSCRSASTAELPARPAASVMAAPLLSAATRPATAAEPQPRPSSEMIADASIPGCTEQSAQAFLVDAHLHLQAMSSTRKQLEWWAKLQRSIRYRTEQYGYYSGFGSPAWNRRALWSQMRATRFMGIRATLHERVIPALRCVERAIERDCRDHPYRPHALAGARQTNTYFGGDVTNHVYGIALDIDPEQNPCCNCVEPWRSNPRCRGKKTEFERMAMPACWVSSFEKYGFYWLGHDELKDTMHFEFLGDPSLVTPSAPE